LAGTLNFIYLSVVNDFAIGYRCILKQIIC
jgi:hypothetical protein